MKAYISPMRPVKVPGKEGIVYKTSIDQLLCQIRSSWFYIWNKERGIRMFCVIPCRVLVSDAYNRS